MFLPSFWNMARLIQAKANASRCLNLIVTTKIIAVFKTGIVGQSDGDFPGFFTISCHKHICCGITIIWIFHIFESSGIETFGYLGFGELTDGCKSSFVWFRFFTNCIGCIDDNFSCQITQFIYDSRN